MEVKPAGLHDELDVESEEKGGLKDNLGILTELTLRLVRQGRAC